MLNHERYKEMAAAAAIGLLPGPEAEELEAHLEECPACRSAQADFEGILQEHLPVVGDRGYWGLRIKSLLGADQGYRQRFIARARSEGVRFSPEVDDPPGKERHWVPVLVRMGAWGVALASVLLVVVLNPMRWGRVERGTPQQEVQALERQIGELAALNKDLRAQVAALVGEESLKTAQLERLESERSRAEGQLADLQKAMGRAQAEEGKLQAQLTSAQAQGAEYESRRQENAQLIGELKAELDLARARGAASEANLTAQQERVRELSDKLAAETVLFQREGQLLAAGKEIRDLMGARNLRIIDVYDFDSKGRNKRVFGRAFYTEGKSLIFYAFDLGRSNHSETEHSFQAWGYHEPSHEPVQSLGIFYADDKKQNRWVLKFDQPQVLAQIDAMFVTIEPPGGSPHPTGQKLLYAYLSGQPNHP